jgi:histidinol-phosphate aminotransferase
MTAQLNRREFLQRSFTGSAGIAGFALGGTPYWKAAAQVLEGAPLRNIRGIGVADPELVELSINENPLGPPRRAIEEVAKRMFGMNRYLMEPVLEEALAKLHGVPPEMVITGVGSTEILRLVTLSSFYERKGNTVTGYPSYPQIPRETEELGRELRRVKLRSDWSLDLEAMAGAIDSETRIVTLCNPNNPTGQVLDPSELRRFLDRVPKEVIVPIDEAYIHFADDPSYPSAIPLAKEYPNVIVARTFSKAYGLGGARVGYGIANPELLKKLKPFGIGELNRNTLSIAAALGALDDPEHVKRTVETVREGKKFLYTELEALGYKPIRTQTIFVTVEVGKGVKALIEALRERKVKVRDAFDMEGYMRISVGLPRENETFIEELRRIPRPSGG